MPEIGYLLDTNALSATRDPRRNPAIVSFLRGLDAATVFVSVITLGEVWKGVAIKHKRHGNATALEYWVERIEQDYADRTLVMDRHIARVWGRITADRTRPRADTLLAATAIVHGLVLVTRNVKDYEDLPVRLLNPWEPA